MVDSRLRQRLGLLASAPRLDTAFSEINHTLDQPRAGKLERLARLFGTPEPAARLAGATPVLTRSWSLGIAGLALLSLVLSTDPTRGDQRFLAYLLLAPILMIAAVAASYGRSTDPAHEIAVAAPMSGSRLLLWRVLAVAPLAIVVNLVIGLALSAGLYAVAWILPALACTMGTLALSTSISTHRAAAIVGAVYLVLVGGVASAASNSLVAFETAGQVTALVVAVGASLTLVARRRHLEEAVLW